MADPYVTPSAAPSSGLSDNIAGGLAYITIIPAIIFLLIEPYKSRPFVRFNCFQNLGIFIVQVVIGILAIFIHILSILSLLLGILALVALVMAFVGKKFVIPGIGPIAESYASKVTF